MVIQLDRCYKINFKNREEGAGANFTLLDGFYEVVRSYGWNELNGAGIDLQKNLLDHAGIVDKTAIRSLQTNWINDAFYLCIGMDRDRQIWVPESIIKGYPDPRIGSYKKLGLVLDLGVFANRSDFETLGKDIMRYLKANYGIDRPDGTVMVYGNQWMTEEEYNNTDLRRKSVQGKAFTNQKVKIRPSSEIITTPVVFTTPVILTKEEEQIQPGAISDTIKIVYSINLTDIPEGSENLDRQCWFYTQSDINNESTMIERSVDSTFTGSILKAIRLKTKFTNENYKWIDAEGNVLYTRALLPAAESDVWSSSLCDDASKLTEPIAVVTQYNESIDQDTGAIVVTESTIKVNNIIYTFDESNYIEVDIGYRCRNTRVVSESPYSLALKYSYKNQELSQRIAALESKLTSRQ